MKLHQCRVVSPKAIVVSDIDGPTKKYIRFKSASGIDAILHGGVVDGAGSIRSQYLERETTSELAKFWDRLLSQPHLTELAVPIYLKNGGWRRVSAGAARRFHDPLGPDGQDGGEVGVVEFDFLLLTSGWFPVGGSEEVHGVQGLIYKFKR